MTLLTVLGAATGITLVVFGLPPVRGGGIAARTEPFLGDRDPRHTAPTFRVLGRCGLLDRPDLVQRLDAAGRDRDVVVFRLEQLVWALAAGGIAAAAVAVRWLSGAGPSITTSSLLLGLGLVSGWSAREWWLTREVDRRNSSIAEQLPSAIDHMALALMAGEAIQGSLQRAGKTVGAPLGAEMARVVAEVRAGSTMLASLERLRARNDHPAVSSFVNALGAAIERGSSLTEVLSAQADEIREARRRELLESGGRREIWMLIPVVFLILPVIVIFALYPGLITLELLVP